MLRTSFSGGLGAAAAVALTAVTAHADSNAIQYRYIPLDQATVPAPFVANTFSPVAIYGDTVTGTLYDDSYNPVVAVWHKGAITIGPAGYADVANSLGLIGGSPPSPSTQAALFFGNTTIAIPPRPGQDAASVVGLSLGGLALVDSDNYSSGTTFAYYFAGQQTVIDFGVPNPLPINSTFMNDFGFIAVEEYTASLYPQSGYRYSPITEKSTPLPPYAGDPLVLVQGINIRNEVLGYSFTSNGPDYYERVGVWNAAGVFETYYYETISTNMLVFNDLNQIVITNPNPAFFFGPYNGTSYLVPEPGTRLDLANLVVNLPAGLYLDSIVAIDNKGNMTGYAEDDNYNVYPFWLKPLADGDPWDQVNVVGWQLPASILEHLENRRTHK